MILCIAMHRFALKMIINMESKRLATLYTINRDRDKNVTACTYFGSGISRKMGFAAAGIRRMKGLAVVGIKGFAVYWDSRQLGLRD